MAKRNPYCIIVIAIVIIAGLFMLVGPVEMSWEEETNAGSVFSGSITAYKDGQPVSEPIIMGAFTRDGVGIDSLVADITWESVGVSIDWTTFSLTGGLVVSVRRYIDGRPEFTSIYSVVFTSGDENGLWSAVLVLGADICTTSLMTDGDGWDLKFDVNFAASVQDTIGQLLTDDISFGGSVRIDYYSNYELKGWLVV